MDLVGKILPCISYKYNGSVSRVYDHLVVLEKDDKYIMAAGNVVQVVEKNNRTWSTSGVLYCVFPIDEFWNAFITKNADSYRIYINIASPITVNDESLSFIDLELDIKIDTLRKLDFQIVDINEFNKKKITMEYPIELDSKIRKTVKELCWKIISIEKSELCDRIDMLEDKLKFITSHRK
jgi:protein associated with RNAse G/E